MPVQSRLSKAIHRTVSAMPENTLFRSRDLYHLLQEDETKEQLLQILYKIRVGKIIRNIRSGGPARYIKL